MISTRSAQQLLEKANELKSRVILIGDTKQLSAIDAGAPFKLLQSAGLPTAVIDQNLRQRDPELKQIVNSLATHDLDPDSVNEAYQKLDRSGKIEQIETSLTRIKAISLDYLSRPQEVRQKTLILASTNEEKRAFASSVRQGLINEGTLANESIKIQTLKRKNIDSDSHRETEQLENNLTEHNRAAEELTREFLHLEQRARSSHIQDREARKPSRKSNSNHPGQFIAKIKQFARDIFTDSQNIKTVQIWSSQLAGGSDNNQTPRTTQRNLDYSVDSQSGDMDLHSYFSPQPKATSRDRGQSQQQRNPPETNRERDRKVKASSTPSLSELIDKLQRSSQREEKKGIDELNQIRRFRNDAEIILAKYGRRNPPHSSCKAFEGENYRIEKDERALPIIALDGRGEIFNYPNDVNSWNLETKVASRLAQKDRELFSGLVREIRQKQQEAQIRWQQEQSQKQQPSRGLEREIVIAFS